MNADMATPVSDLSDLHRIWSGHWHIWRSRRIGDLGEERTGEYVATRLTPQAGTARTILAASPGDLDAELRRQRADVLAGIEPADVIAAQWPGE